MSERFSSFDSSRKPASPEDEKTLESLEKARGIWIENINRFDELVPVDPVIVDETTIEFGTLRAWMLGQLLDLDKIEEELKTGSGT